MRPDLKSSPSSLLCNLKTMSGFPGLGGSVQNPVTTTLAQFDYENRSVSSSLFTGLTVENVPMQSEDFIKHVLWQPD